MSVPTIRLSESGGSPDAVRHIAANVARGRFLEVADAAPLAPAEQPERVADLFLSSATSTPVRPQK